MMPNYHIGSLDEASRSILADPEDTTTDSAPREIFLQSRTWSKAILTTKKTVSLDTRIFSFSLDHAAQIIGLPIGQHLMMRLRDPVTREAIIRSYTPISESSDVGVLHVLVKIYDDTLERPGGKMTKALDAIPLGHFVDFKGPIGKFEYKGRGRCEIGGKPRDVKRFVMICGGSGITPIFQVLRAVLKDRVDPTTCLLLDGNRLEEDILCKEELDSLLKGNEGRCKVVHALSKPSDTWTGVRGRVGKELLEKEVGQSDGMGDTLVLICGPEALEKGVHGLLGQLGWNDDDLLFF